ncbi:PD40 domain-containing protein [bacterium]|nr:PD40 domain-containing protein [bacterium]
MKRILSIIVVITVTTTYIRAQEIDTATLTGPYLGQTPPGTTPEKFAPGIVSTDDHVEMGCTWSADGKTFCFGRSETPDMSSNWSIWEISEKKDGWSDPAALPFCGVYRDVAPSFARGGNTLIFFRMDNGENKTRMGSRIVDREGETWGEPRFFHEGYCLNTNDFHVFYFTTDRREKTSKDIAVMTRENGFFSEPANVPGELNSPEWEAHAVISPDGQYILFDRVESAYVSFLRDDGTWGPGIDTGRKLRIPCISPEGKYIFFESGGDIWWVDAGCIEALKRDDYRAGKR